MSPGVFKLFIGGLLSLVLPATVCGEGVPLAVSPGGSTTFTTVATTCPTFSWAHAGPAVGYDLLVYRLPTAGAASNAGTHAVLRLRLPAMARAWTPSLEQALVRGERYAWTFRAMGQLQEEGEWSAPLFFRIAAGLGEDEFRQALGIVRSYLAEASTDERSTTSLEAREPLSPQEPALSAEAAPRPPETAALGVADFSVDASGNVQGTSFSGDGRGLSGVTAEGLDCTDCVSEVELDFAPLEASDLNTEAKLEALLADVTNILTDNDALQAADLDCTDCVSETELDFAPLEPTDLNTEAKLEALLADVTNVLTDNDAITATDLDCTDCVSEAELDFAPLEPTDLDTEVELEALLGDVANVLTNNDLLMADSLDSLDSDQFVRSDTSTTLTAGTLTTKAGTIVDIDGTLQLPATGISGAGDGSGLNADKLDDLDRGDFETAICDLYVLTSNAYPSSVTCSCRTLDEDCTLNEHCCSSNCTAGTCSAP